MSGLIKYEAARTALSECKAVDEVKQWADKAAAMQAYGRMAKDKTLEIDAAEIRIRAERKLGEMLAAQKENTGLNVGGRPSQKPVVNDDQFHTPTLKDAGISKDLSSRSQKLAAVPEQEFEKEVGDWRERVEKEGKRVSARLQKAGEKAIKNNKTSEPDDELIEIEKSEYEDMKSKIQELSDMAIDLEEENQNLRDAIAVNQLPESEIQSAEEIISELRAELSNIKIKLQAVTDSRDSYLRENTMLKEQCKRQAAQLKKMGVKNNA